MSTNRSLLKSENLRLAAAWLLLLLAWEGGYRLVGWRPWVFPAPSHVADATFNMLGFRTALGDPLSPHWPWPAPAPQAIPAGSFAAAPLLWAIAVSLVRLVVGFAIAGGAGLLLGLLMWRFNFANRLLGPASLGLQTLPSVCWVPLAILTFGISETGILFVMVMGSVFAIALALRDGLRATPPIYRLAGLMLGARGWRLYSRVLLPAAMPALAGSLRQGFSFAWRSLMGGELILLLQRHGLGFLLQTGRDFQDIAQVVAVMLVMVAIGMTADRVIFARIETNVRQRFGLA